MLRLLAQRFILPHLELHLGLQFYYLLDQFHHRHLFDALVRDRVKRVLSGQQHEENNAGAPQIDLFSMAK